MIINVRTEIQIDAPAHVIWAIVTDFPQYGSWNPFIPLAIGAAVTGSKLYVEIKPPGLRRSSCRLKILEVEPQTRLRWLGHLLFPGLMDGDHVFEIEPLGPSRCRLVQAEEFRGLFVPIMSPWLKKNLPQGFEVMNAAVKRRAEDQTRAAVCAGPERASSVPNEMEPVR